VQGLALHEQDMEKISRGIPKDVMQNNSLTQRVLYGAWDVTKKAGTIIESQSPRAWNERIIKVINEKIIPKLTPEQLALVAKHHRGIETAAHIGGIITSTAELYVIFALAGLGKKNIDRMRMNYSYKKKLDGAIHSGLWFQDLKQKFMGISGHRPEQFGALAGTLVFLGNALIGEKKARDFQKSKVIVHFDAVSEKKKIARKSEKLKPGRIGMLSAVGNPKQAEMSLRILYRQAHREKAAYEAALRGKHIPDDATVNAEADVLFAGWQATLFHGVEGLLNAAGVRNSRARRAFRNIQGLQTQDVGSLSFIAVGASTEELDEDGIVHVVQNVQDVHRDRDALHVFAHRAAHPPRIEKRSDMQQSKKPRLRQVYQG